MAVRHRDESAAWQVAQRYCFLGWLNHQFSKAKMEPVSDLKTCFKSGERLHDLLWFLSHGQDVGKVKRNPTMKVQEMENLSICFNFMKTQGIHFENLGAIDIHEENYTLIMGLLWALISHYQVAGHLDFSKEHQEKKAARERLEKAKKDLLAWCKKRCIAHGVEVTNFKKSWQDGSAFSSLAATIHRDHNYWVHESEDNLEKLGNAFEFFDSPLDIPQLLQAHTLAESPDEKSIITYLSLIYEKYKDYPILVSERPRDYEFAFDGLDGDGNLNAVVDVEKHVFMAMHEGDGKPIPPDDKLEVKMVSDKGETPVIFSVGEDGKLDLKFTPEHTGEHKLQMIYDGKLLAEQNVVVSDPYCELYGDGVECASIGRPVDFTALFRDAEGGNVLLAGDKFGVTVTGPNGAVKTEVEQSDDGRNVVTYEPTAAGLHKIAVTYRGNVVREASVPVYDLEFTGLGADGSGSDAIVDVLKEFQLGFKDGNGYAAPPDVSMVLKGPSGETQCAVTPGADGPFDCSFTAVAAGAHTLEVRCGNVLLRELPVNVTDLIVDASGPGLSCGATNNGTAFQFAFLNREGGEPVDPADNARVVITGPAGEVACTATAGENGFTEVAYTPQVPGDHKVEIQYRGKTLFEKSVPVYDFELTGLNADGEGNTAVVDVLSSFGLGVRGGAGLVVPDGLEVFLTGPSGEIRCEMEKNADGTVQCSYTPTMAGAHNVEIRCDGQTLRTVGVAVQDLHVEWEGEGLVAGRVGQEAAFVVSLYDVPGGTLVAPGDRLKVVVECDGEAVPATVTVDEEGRAHVVYTPARVGDHRIAAVYREKELKTTSVPIIDFDLDLSGFETDENGRLISIIDVEKLIGLAVKSSKGDVDGLPAGLALLMVTPAGESECPTKVTKKGTLAAVVCGESLGDYTLKVSYNGVVLQNIPIVVKMQHVTVEGLKSLPVGKMCHVTVVFRTKEGGKVVPSHGRMTLMVRNERLDEEVSVTTEELQSGENEALFKAESPGKHVMIVRYREYEVFTGPFTAYAISLDGISTDGDGNTAVVDVLRSFLLGIDSGEGFFTPDDLEVRLVGPSGELGCAMAPQEDKQLECSYVPSALGPHNIIIKCDGDVLYEIPVDVINPKVPVEGLGLVAACLGATSPFTVACLDNDDEPFVPPAGRLTVEVLDDQGQPLALGSGYNDKNIQDVSYTPQAVGLHTIRVAYGESDMFFQNVDVVSFTFEGLGTKVAIVNAESTFSMLMRKKPEGPAEPMGDFVEAHLLDSEGSETPCMILANEDATSLVSYVPTIPGEQVISILYRGLIVKKFSVMAYAMHVTGDGFHKAYLNLPARFEAYFDEEVMSSPDVAVNLADISASITCANVELEHNTKVEGDRVHFKYTPRAAEEHNISVFYASSPAVFSTVDVKPVLWHVDGDCMKFAKAGLKNTLRIRGTDPDTGASVLPTEDTTFSIVGPDEIEVDMHVTWADDGTATIDFAPEIAGLHDAFVVVDNDRVHHLDFPTYRYEFDGDAMMGCCCKMSATFSLMILCDEASPPLPPDNLAVQVHYVATDNEIPTTVMDRTKTQIRYEFTPTSPGPVKLVVSHLKEQVYKSRLNVSLPRFTFEGEGANTAIVGKMAKFEVQQLHPFTLEPIPQNLFFVKALMKDPDSKPLPMKKKTTLEGELTCEYIPKVTGNHRIEINCDGKSVWQKGLPKIVEVSDADVGKKGAGSEESGQKGTLRVYLEEDDVLSSMNLSNTFKMIPITDRMKAGEVKRIMVEKMSKALDDKQIAQMYQHCMYFCIAEVPLNAEALKEKKKEALKRYETSHGMVEITEEDDGVDPEGRRLLRNELVWPWRYSNQKDDDLKQDTILVFKELVGKVDFYIKFPKSAVTEAVMPITMKIRDPANGNCLVNNHKGELECRIRTPSGDKIEVPGEKAVGDGCHCIPFVPTEPGVHFLMIIFNGAQVHDRHAKVSVHNKSSIGFVNLFKK